jgi:hypothetical protein
VNAPMEPEELGRELARRGVVLLGVGRHRKDPGLLIVYLHSNAGQWQDGSARHALLAVPGVVGVTASPQSPAILLVTVSGATGEGAQEPGAAAGSGDGHGDKAGAGVNPPPPPGETPPPGG